MPTPLMQLSKEKKKRRMRLEGEAVEGMFTCAHHRDADRLI